MLSSSADIYSMGSGVPVQWSEQSVHIKDFSAKYPVPNIVKVTKGQYRNIGVSKSVSNELYLHSVTVISKVLAESVKMKEGKSKVVVSDQKYSLPVTYKGWFELLSQDGKAIKAIVSVQELARFFPASCLVRENIKAFIQRGSGELSLDRTRVVQAGEVLTLVGEIWVPFMMGKVMAKRKILKCLDSDGEEVFFGLEQKGTFSPIAGQNNISGVHNIKGLLDKFRLPLMVRLVHGVIPTKMEKGFTGVFRFVNIYSDENAFVCPLKKDAKMLPISTREPLKVAACQNFDRLSKMEGCVAIQKKCQEMLDSYTNSIHILICMPDSAAMVKGKPDLLNMDIELNVSSDQRNGQQSISALSQDQPLSQAIPTMSEVEEDLLFQEIDGIYQYVREGGPPPRPKTQKIPSAPIRKNSTDSRQARPVITDSIQTLNQDPSMDMKMQHLDLTTEHEYEDNATKGNLPKRDGYNWEEPIYEPLEKIRAQKKMMEAQKTGFDTPPETVVPEQGDITPDQVNNNIVSESQVPAKSTAAPTPYTMHQSTGYLHSGVYRITPDTSPPAVEAGTPVSSLRQVMKSGGYQDIQRHRSVSGDQRPVGNRIEPSSKGMAPPVPPKRFDDLPTNGNSKATHGNGNFGKVHQGFSNRVSGTVGNMTYNTSSSSGSSDSPQEHPQRRKLQHSLSTPYGSQSPDSGLPSSHPPYVAVARVGDYQNQTGKTAVVNNVNNYRRSNSVDHVRTGQKLHSMYL